MTRRLVWFCLSIIRVCVCVFCNAYAHLHVWICTVTFCVPLFGRLISVFFERFYVCAGVCDLTHMTLGYVDVYMTCVYAYATVSC